MARSLRINYPVHFTGREITANPALSEVVARISARVKS